MAVGRHRRSLGTIYGRKKVVDSRGNEIVVVDFERPLRAFMDVKQIRANRSEIKGQLTNEVMRLFVSAKTVDGEALTDLGPWTVVEFGGRRWDAAVPPIFVPGTRRTAHWEFEVKPLDSSDVRGVGGL